MGKWIFLDVFLPSGLKDWTGPRPLSPNSLSLPRDIQAQRSSLLNMLGGVGWLASFLAKFGPQ